MAGNYIDSRRNFIFVATQLNNIIERGLGRWLDSLVLRGEVSFEFVWLLLNHAREHDLDPR